MNRRDFLKLSASFSAFPFIQFSNKAERDFRKYVKENFQLKEFDDYIWRLFRAIEKEPKELYFSKFRQGGFTTFMHCYLNWKQSLGYNALMVFPNYLQNKLLSKNAINCISYHDISYIRCISNHFDIIALDEFSFFKNQENWSDKYIGNCKIIAYSTLNNKNDFFYKKLTSSPRKYQCHYKEKFKNELNPIHRLNPNFSSEFLQHF